MQRDFTSVSKPFKYSNGYATSDVNTLVEIQSNCLAARLKVMNHVTVDPTHL